MTPPLRPEDWRRLALLLPNWLGDAVMCQPALAAIGDAHPDLEMVAFGRPASVEALRDQAGIASLRVVDDRGPLGPLRLGAAIRSHRPDAVLLLRGSFRSALAARLSGCPIRIGTPGDGRRLLISHPVSHDSSGHPMPTTALYASLATALQATVASDHPRLQLPREERERARRSLADLPRPVLGVVPGGSKLPKRWPAAAFVEALERLSSTFESCVLFGGPDEQELLREIRDDIRASGAMPVLDMQESDHGLDELRGLVAACDVLLANDTGPRHLAIATGVPTVSLFGPTDHRWTLIPGADERLLLAEPFLDEAHVADRHPDACRIDRIAVGDVVHACRAALRSRVSSGT